jgi:CO/xanthine dehydrogenase Mo-binding subunit/aerobic-type carbon monoxide dehydrogenase small subunit (CoxS/CutS family)
MEVSALRSRSMQSSKNISADKVPFVCFIVNGKPVTAEAWKGRTLMSFIREELGLTGTKCGCASGDCGSCKVILDGEAVNSCTVLLTKLEGAKITTIEGLTPEAEAEKGTLHPVQQAFIDAGAVQCGFCTPGMIISAAALLEKIPDPPEQEIRRALKGNICRCTGYGAIVRAIKAAAASLTAPSKNNPPGKTMEDSAPPVGSPSPLRDAQQKVTGRVRYTGDMVFPRMLVGKILYAPAAHGIVQSIDCSEAEALPGVHAVLHFGNSPEKPFNSHITVPFQDVPKNEQIFNRHFRFHGDRIAAVVAEDDKTASRAISLIRLKWNPLPFIPDLDSALAPGAEPVHKGGNLADTIAQSAGTTREQPEDLTPGESSFFQDRFSFQRVSHAALERHISIADFDGETLTVYTSCQNVFCYQAMLAELFDLPFHRVHLVKPPVGGAFGGKSEMVTEPVSALLAIKTGRTVKVELSRKEVFSSTRTRTSGDIDLAIEVDGRGKFLSHRYQARLDRGAYFGSAYDLGYALMDKAYRLYRVPRISTEAKLVYTNNQAAGAQRGYGNPQISFAREVLIDRVCRKRNEDPVELRLRNVVMPGDTNPLNGETLGNCRIADCLREGARLFDWKYKRKLYTPGSGKGIGLACGVHGSGIYPDCVDYSTASLKMNSDGTAILAISAHENGQGSSVVMAKIAAEVLEIPENSIAIAETDTRTTYWDNGSYASRETWVCGGAVAKAANSVKEQLRREAAAIFGCSVEEVEARNGHCIATGNITYSEIVSHAQRNYPFCDISAVESYASPFDPGAYFVNFVELTADKASKTIRLEKVLAVHDSGKIINPLMIRGQVEGGLHMGLGYALCEEILTDPATGKQKTISFRNYTMLRPLEMPDIEVHFIETHEHQGPFGAKGIGEATTVAIAPALVNALSYALDRDFSSLPVRI